MLNLSFTCRIAPKLTANPLPLASSVASAKSVPVATPSIANVVPTGRPAGMRSASGTSWVDRSARWRSLRWLVM